MRHVVSKCVNISVKRQIKDVWFQMYSWLEKTPDVDGNVRLYCTYCKADSRSQSDFGCSSFKKDTLRKHQLSMKHRLAQDSYINKQQFMSTPKLAPMHARIQQKADESTMKDLDIKFRTPYLIAKDEMSF